MRILDRLRRRPGAAEEQDRPTHTRPLRPPADETEDVLVPTFKATIERCWSLRERYARMWMYCEAFLRGDQWGPWDTENRESGYDRKLLPSPIEDAKCTDNQLPIYVGKHVVYFHQAMPRLQAQPASNTDELSKLRAELASRILEVRENPDSGDERALRMRAVRNILLLGEVFARPHWDASALGGKGDLAVELVDVFGCLKDPYSVGMWPPRFLIEMDCRHVDEIHDIYGIWVSPEGGLVQRTQYYDTLAVSVGQSNWDQVRPPMQDAAMVYRIGFSPCETYPNGMCFHLIGDKIPRRHEWQGGMWPYVRAVWEDSDLNLYAVGLAERLLTDQIRMNMLESLGFQTAIVKARGDIWVSGPDHKPRREVYNEATGAEITHISPRSQIKPRETGMDFRDARFQLELIDDNMHRKANLPRPALGQPLERERTLGAQVMSQQAAGTDAGEKVALFAEQFLVPIATRELRLCSIYAVTPREIDMGPSGGIFMWHRGDLEGIQNVTAEAVPHMSPATRRSMIATARAEGLMPPYPNARAEASARQVLLSLGLSSLEKRIAEQSAPLEAVLEMARMERAVAYRLQLMGAVATLLQIQNVMAAAGGAGTEQAGGTPGREGLPGGGTPADSELPESMRRPTPPGAGVGEQRVITEGTQHSAVLG